MNRHILILSILLFSLCGCVREINSGDPKMDKLHYLEQYSDSKYDNLIIQPLNVIAKTVIINDYLAGEHQDKDSTKFDNDIFVNIDSTEYLIDNLYIKSNGLLLEDDGAEWDISYKTKLKMDFVKYLYLELKDRLSNKKSEGEDMIKNIRFIIKNQRGGYLFIRKFSNYSTLEYVHHSTDKAYNINIVRNNKSAGINIKLSLNLSIYEDGGYVVKVYANNLEYYCKKNYYNINWVENGEFVIEVLKDNKVLDRMVRTINNNKVSYKLN